MRYAIVSDIHSNRQAWRAVLSDVLRQDADLIICLGDVVGYGPSPAEVLDSVMQNCKGVIIGNHEAVIGGRCDADIFNASARRTIEWTAAQLGPSASRSFAQLPSDIDADTFLASHAEILEPERFNYIETPEDAIENFNAGQFEILFVGHTHVSGIHVMDTATRRVSTAPAADFTMRDGLRYIVNGGSVGDSRDDDPRASYCIFDEEKRQIFFHKVDFDVAAYKRELMRSGVNFKPFFLTFFEHVNAHPDKPAHDWCVQVTPPKAVPAVAVPLPAQPARPAQAAAPVQAHPTLSSPKSDRFQHVEPREIKSGQSWCVRLDVPAPPPTPPTPPPPPQGKTQRIVIRKPADRKVNPETNRSTP